MSKKSPTQLSLDYLCKLGYTCQITEKWIPGANVRKDLFDFGDICAYHFRGIIALVQTSTADHFNERKEKILASPHHRGWKKAGGIILLHGWGKNGLREEEL